MINIKCIIALTALWSFQLHAQNLPKVGAYYFDGWTGKTFHVSAKLKKDFSDREPIWGWQTSNATAVRQQIDAAANAGIDFFNFCWYFNPKTQNGAIGSDPRNNALKLYLSAPNKNRLGFGIMVANHKGYHIKSEDWKDLCSYWIELFKDPSYLKLDGKPMISFFEVQSLIGTFGHSKQVAIAFQALRDQAIEAGLKGVTIAGCVENNKEAIALAERCGFDVLTGYNYHSYGLQSAKEEVVSIDSMRTSESRLWSQVSAKTKKPYIPVITLNWDRRPWDTKAVKRSPRFAGYSGESVKKAVLSCRKWINSNATETVNEKIMLIYAWNEYGEGAWLTPSKKSKNTLLEGLQKGLK